MKSQKPLPIPPRYLAADAASSNSMPGLNRAGRRKLKIAPKLQAWRLALLAGGGKVPANPRRPDEPDYRAVAHAIQANPQLVADPDRPHFKFITKTARELGLEPTAPKIRREGQPVQPKLDAWAQGLREAGEKVPANPAHPDQPDFMGIGERLDVNPCVLRLETLPYVGFIKALARELGFAVATPTPITAPITIAELAEALRRDRGAAPTEQGEPPTRKQLDAATANANWALNRLIGPFAESIASPAAPAIDAALAAIGAGPDADRRWAGELRRCQAGLAAFGADGLPNSLAGALNFVLGRSGRSLAAMARELKLHAAVLRDWSFGRRNPSRDAMVRLSKLEALLDLASGALTERYRASARETLRQPDKKEGDRRRTAPPKPKVTGGKRGAPRGTGLAFPRDWPLERDAAGKPIYVRPSLWPVSLRDERDLLMQFRGNAMAPFDLKRDGDIWTPGTQSLRDAELGRLFAWIARSFAFVGGKDALSFAFLICPRLANDFIDGRVADRRARTGRDRLTTCDLALLRLARSLFHPEHGWITQQPAFAARLRPIADAATGDVLLSSEDVAAAQGDWPGACQRAYRAYDKACKSNWRSVSVVDAKEAYRAILRLEDPLLAFRLGAEGLNQEIMRLSRDSHAYCIAVRDRVAWGIEAQTGLRVNNLLLTYAEDNSGQLRLVNGNFELHISRLLFKNANGPYFRNKDSFRDYHKVLLDENGLHDHIRELIGYCNPLLRKGKPSNGLFISHLWGAPLGRAGIINSIQSTYNRYVLWDPKRRSGIEGAQRTSVHWGRAALAMGVLKQTGDEQLAADAIHDSVKTVRKFYVDSLPADRAKALDAALRQGFLGDRGDRAKPPTARQSQRRGSPRHPGRRPRRRR